MKLFEFQGKGIFRRYGIRVPDSQLVTDRNEKVTLSAPVVLKSQVLTGGRGKAGGIIVCSNNEEIASGLDDLFTKEINGEPVSAVLVEDAADIENEFYLAITLDGGNGTPILIASAAGGVDIETVAKETPDKIVTTPFNILTGPSDYQVRLVARAIDYPDARELTALVKQMFTAFTESDATLVEINPLAQTPEGLVALDAKVLLDDNAAFRQRDFFQELLSEQNRLLNASETMEREDTITFVDLEGDVGMISDGAGTGMLTLDLIRDAGGEAATFCEMGGITSPQVIYDAISKVMERTPPVKSLLIVLIGGFNRMDEMAEGIIKYREEHGIDVPLVVRMCGTLEEVGKEMMTEAGLPTYDSLLESVDQAVALAKGDC